ncbi:Vegetative incompatibility protein [Paramyrothecium foliicola]|nr:Vegetative incompatibility protein [Paramyrothecium foliicola]
MADPLSIGASVLAFIGLADRIIRASQYVVDSIQDAPNDVRMILGEVISLRAIVESLEIQEWSDDSTPGLLADLFKTSGPIDTCRRCLSELEGLLPSFAKEDSGISKRRLHISQLAWPLKQSKARKLLAEISHHKATLLLAISGDVVHSLKDIKTKLSQLQEVMSDSERHEVLKWLEQINPSTLHNEAYKKHELRTSIWLISSLEWKSWLDESSPDKFLWIYGIPGSGKTVLASFIVEQLKKLYGGDNDYQCAYYYCHYTHNRDEATSLLRWAISQICRRNKWVPHQLKDLYDLGCDTSIPDLENVLEAVLERLQVFYLVIDAVDESIPRSDLLSLIATLAVDKRFQKIRVLATSRQYFDIERMFSGISTSISMSNPLVDADIRWFVRDKLASSYRLQRWKHMFGEIEDTLVAKAQGMFRWADCQIQSIERLRDFSQLESRLRDMPRDLSETYVRIFESIPESERSIVRRILIWVFGHSRSPWLPPDSDRGQQASLFDCDYLQELCGCLITIRAIQKTGGFNRAGDAQKMIGLFGTLTTKDVTPSDITNVEYTGQPDGSDVYASIAHYTVMEFLSSPHILSTSVSSFAMSSDYMITEFCASILRQAVEADPGGSGTDWAHDREPYCLTLGLERRNVS